MGYSLVPRRIIYLMRLGTRLHVHGIVIHHTTGTLTSASPKGMYIRVEFLYVPAEIGQVRPNDAIPSQRSIILLNTGVIL